MVENDTALNNSIFFLNFLTLHVYTELVAPPPPCEIESTESVRCIDV